MGIKGSKTEKNLYKTFAGESRATVKYLIFAEIARCEGYRWIAEIFEETASNEKAHAREVLKDYLNKTGTTEENLLDSARGEHDETSKMYKEFEEIAKEEGFNDIEHFYKELREVEESHYERYSKLLEKIKEKKVFKGDEVKQWKCMNCGYIYEGIEAPEHCPLCGYPRSYFKPYSCKNE